MHPLYNAYFYIFQHRAVMQYSIATLIKTGALLLRITLDLILQGLTVDMIFKDAERKEFKLSSKILASTIQLMNLPRNIYFFILNTLFDL